MIRDNVVLLVAPLDGVTPSGYRISTSVGDKSDAQPPEREDAAPFGSTIAVVPVPGVETAEAFVVALGNALTSGDIAFVRSRLHPAVIERYGAAACDSYLASRSAPVSFTPKEVRAPATYAWTTDGQTTDIPQTNQVVVTQAAGGGSTERVVHVTRVDGTWRWFTDCTT